MDIQTLLAALKGGQMPQTPQMGSGMAQQAMSTLAGRGYQLHVQEAQAMGQQPMTPEQFAQQQTPKGKGLLGY